MAKIAEGIFPRVNIIIINVNVKMILLSFAECSLSLIILLLIFWEVFVKNIGGFFILDLSNPFLGVSSALMLEVDLKY